VQTAFNAVMAMNPIALVVLALVGLGVALTVAYKRSDKFRAFIDKMWAGIKTATMVVLNFFKVTVPKAFVTAFNAVTGFLKKWGMVLLTVIGAPVRLVAGLVVSAWNKVKSTTVAVFTTVWNWLKNVWNGIKTTVSSAVTAIWGAVKGAFDRVVGVVTAWGMKMLSKILTTWTAIKNTFLAGVQTIWNVIKSGWDKVFSVTNSLMTKVWNKITAIWGQIVSGVKAAGTKLWTAVSDMWGKVTGFFAGINLYEIGKNIIQGLINGISSMVETLKTTMSDIANGIADKVREVLGIHSPSRVMMEVGFYTGEGLINGLEDITPNVGLASGGMANEVINNQPTSNSEEFSRYTPETAPARTSNNQRVNFTAPAINITIQGNADSNTVQQIGNVVDQKLQDIIDAVSRIMGVEISGAN
jgi:phage-related protein